MNKFNKPDKLDGAQLLVELNAEGIKISEIPFVDGNGDLWLDISNKDKEKANAIVDSHIPKPKTKLTIEQKLASVGLNLDDLKIALGL